MNVDSIHKVAVLGLGTMGHGIAQAFSMAGLTVRCYDSQPAARAGLADRVRKNLGYLVEAGVFSGDEVPIVVGRLVTCESEGEAVRSAQFTTEAVAEDLTVKQDLFARLEPMLGPEAIVASNSSSFPMTAIAARMQRPERAILCHWFNPPPIIPVVEVAPGQRTAEETTHTTMELLTRIGKTPVYVRQEVPGLIVNRVQMAMRRELWNLVEQGVASAEDIDRAIRGSMGLRLPIMGPLQVMDFAGLDVSSRVYENLAPDLRSDAEIPNHIRAMLAAGHFGVKTGQGFFRYTAESAARQQARRDRLCLALIKMLREEGESHPSGERTDSK